MKAAEQTRDRYAVVGHPVSHSLSPWIHARFADATNQHMVYGAMDVAPGCFHRALHAFFAAGGRGCNVTLPWKLHAYRLADSRSDRAVAAGAVNTLARRTDGSVYGDNTDGAGLTEDLHHAGLDLTGARVLIAGAGGAARGAIASLLAEGTRGPVVANRTAARARALADRFGAGVTGCGYDELRGPFDLIVNATAASLAGTVPAIPLACLEGAPLCYDMMYAAEPTPFVSWAVRHGAPARDGLGMLVEQAAESFLLWRGVRPATAPVLNALRNRLRHPWPDSDPSAAHSEPPRT